MAVDYNDKIKEIHNDYYSALGKFANIERLIKSVDLEIKSEDSEEVKKLKVAQTNEILVDLGRVGEMAFKYLIRLEQINAYPNQPLDQFQKDALFKKGPLKSYGQRKSIAESSIQTLVDYTDVNNQPLHNFDYLFMFIETMMPDIAAKFNKTIEYRLSSKLVEQMPNYDFYDNEYIVFPEETYYAIIDQETSVTKREELKKLRRETIKQSGDVFTRLRYFANNPHDKTFNIYDVYALMQDVIFFIELIYQNNDDLNVNLEIAYARKMLVENPSLVDRPINDALDIMEFPRIKNNPRVIADFLYYSKEYSFEELKDVANDTRIDINDYVLVLCNALTKADIDFFLSHNIRDYDDMAGIMTKRGNKSFAQLLNDHRYTLDEIKSIASTIEADKYQNLMLLKWMSPETVKALNANPVIRDFLLANEKLFNVLPGQRPYGISELFIFDLVSTDVITNNPRLLYSCDESQYVIYGEISNFLLRKNPSFESVINKSNAYPDMWIEHVKENCEIFKDCPQVLERLPLFLDGEDHKKILDILIMNGLDVDNIKTLDTTVFCIPFVLFNTITSAMIKNGQSIIVDNNMNPLFFEYIDQMINNLNGSKTESKKEHNYQNKRKSLIDIPADEPIYRYELG